MDNQRNDTRTIRTHLGCDVAHMTTVLGLPKYGGDAMVQAIEEGLASPQRATRKLYGVQRRLIAAEQHLPPVAVVSTPASGARREAGGSLYLHTRFPRFFVQLLPQGADLKRFHPQEIRKTSLDDRYLGVVAWIDDTAAVTEQQLASAMDETLQVVESDLEVPFLAAPDTSSIPEEQRVRPEDLPDD